MREMRETVTLESLAKRVREGFDASTTCECELRERCRGERQLPDGLYHHCDCRPADRDCERGVSYLEGVVVRDVAWYRERDAFVAGYYRGAILVAVAMLVLSLLKEWS